MRDCVSELAAGSELCRLQILVEGGLLRKFRVLFCISIDDPYLIAQ